MEVPEHLEADVSGMHIGDTLRLSSLTPPAGVTLLDDLEETVLATVTQPTRVEEPEPVEGEEGAEGSRGRGARAARPRVRRRRCRRRRRRVRHHRGLSPLRDAALAAQTRHLPRPPGRRPRKPWPRVRTQPAQRRLAGRRRARTPARRLVARQVRRPARGDPDRRAQGRAAEARDVHERVGKVGARRVGVLQDSTRMPCSSCTTRATSTRAACRLASAAGSPVTTACARSRSTSARPTSCACASASAGPAAATSGGSPTTCSPTSSRTTTRNGSSPRAADAVETLDAEGLEAAQRAVNGKRS